MTLRKTLQTILIAISACGCVSKLSDKSLTLNDEVKQGLANMTDKDLDPHYNTLYTPDSVTLDNIDTLLSGKNIDQFTSLTILSNSCKELKADYNNYLLDYYKTLSVTEDKLTYLDIGNMARFIVWKFKSDETVCFDNIFEHAEILLKNGDEATQHLIVVGLFEGIQHVGSWHTIDYHKGFDIWLRPESKKAWDELIEGWEGKKSQ